MTVIGAPGLVLMFGVRVTVTRAPAATYSINTEQRWNVPETINQLSQQVGLEAGDVIMTGTPAGVGQIAVGDVLECEVEGVGTLKVTMAPMEKEYAKPA